MSNVNEDQERYLYTIYPKKIIRNLNENIPVISSPKSLLLTKDEAKKCLEAASLYRWFANEKTTERITVYDLDRVHRAEHISKEDWKKIIDADKNVDILSVNGVELVSEETPVEEVVEPVESEDTDTLEEVSETEAEEEVVEETSEDEVVEEDTTEENDEADDTVVEEEAPILVPATPVNTNTSKQQHQLSYNKNNKNKKH